ncbi:hypothetical protein EV143_11345 [Flavobacterium chryseum]|uniref:DUF6252 family protein n=1 Tax=Flavobacterium sp. P3160 TaxID=2512113 RepID=UPI00105D4446|nr:DUF6252 family protein [Flavobacterium sp. P3160]TDO69870.1 hypothetical protein EV143_11345 [Flavobacterium sp. P3160]
MKTPKILFLFLLLVLNSCSSDNNSDSPEDSENQTSKFAMTAKVDGTLWEMNNPFGSDYATTFMSDYYPEEEYILLQGRINFGDEIRLYIKRSDLKVGTYPLTKNTYDASKTQVEISYSNKAKSQYPVDGSLSVTAIDLNAKKVTGTFSFNCVEDDSKPISTSNPVTAKVTLGTFNYRYDVQK